MLNNLEKQFVAYLFRLKAEGVLKKQNSLKDLNLSVSKTIMCFKSVGDTESAWIVQHCCIFTRFYLSI